MNLPQEPVTSPYEVRAFRVYHTHPSVEAEEAGEVGEVHVEVMVGIEGIEESNRIGLLLNADQALAMMEDLSNHTRRILVDGLCMDEAIAEGEEEDEEDD